MTTEIFKNSYVILAISFVTLCILFYAFNIGYETVVKDNKIIRKYSWKYQLAISLIIWVFWHFYVYPPDEVINDFMPTKQVGLSDTVGRGSQINPIVKHINNDQKINMNMWY